MMLWFILSSRLYAEDGGAVWRKKKKKKKKKRTKCRGVRWQ